jgi:hypothetical protein
MWEPLRYFAAAAEGTEMFLKTWFTPFTNISLQFAILYLRKGTFSKNSFF